MGTQATIKGEYREIFVNPTPNEINDIIEYGGVREKDDVRFIAIKNSRDLYITSADVFHRTIVKEVDELREGDAIKNFSGMGSVNSDKIKVSYLSDLINNKATKGQKWDISKDLVEGEYDWLENYNFNLEYIKEKAEKMKTELEMSVR